MSRATLIATAASARRPARSSHSVWVRRLSHRRDTPFEQQFLHLDSLQPAPQCQVIDDTNEIADRAA